MAGGDHHAEERQACHIVAGAVDGVDQESQIGVDQHIEQGGIAGRGFFADQHGARMQPGQARGDEAFGGFVRVGYEVPRGTLAAHRAFRQVAKARHDFRLRRFGQDGRKPAGVLAGKGSAHSGWACSTGERANLPCRVSKACNGLVWGA
ncbi:hypothetical protein D9M69_623470 [compost metagenome]